MKKKKNKLLNRVSSGVLTLIILIILVLSISMAVKGLGLLVFFLVLFAPMIAVAVILSSFGAGFIFHKKKRIYGILLAVIGLFISVALFNFVSGSGFLCHFQRCINVIGEMLSRWASVMKLSKRIMQ